MTSWWNDKLMKRQIDEMTSWQNGKLMKWQVDKMTSWQNHKMTIWHGTNNIRSQQFQKSHFEKLEFWVNFLKCHNKTKFLKLIFNKNLGCDSKKTTTIILNTEVSFSHFLTHCQRRWQHSNPWSGITKGGSITVPLTSCLTGLVSTVWQLAIFVFICKTH